MSDYLGRGWAFPIDLDVGGRVALVERERDIEQAIVIILGTPKGQRVLRPEFGSRLHELVFAPLNTTTIGLATYYVEQALAMWEPRIKVLTINVAPVADDIGQLAIAIDYEIKATYDRRSLVYPFYRIPPE